MEKATARYQSNVILYIIAALQLSLLLHFTTLFHYLPPRDTSRKYKHNRIYEQTDPAVPKILRLPATAPGAFILLSTNFHLGKPRDKRAQK